MKTVLGFSIGIAIMYVIGTLTPVPTQAANVGDVQRIYNKILAANPGIKVVPIEVKRDIYSWCSEACNTGTRIYVSIEALSDVRNEDELAGLIGHEEAHFVFKDEMKADVLGLNYAAKAGYNYCVAAQILKSYEGDDVHPVGSIRYANTGCL